MPLLNNLTGTNLGNKSLSLNIIDMMIFDANITNITITKSQLVQKDRIVELLDDVFKFNLENLTINLGYNYEYISDPPYLVDIGDT